MKQYPLLFVLLLALFIAGPTLARAQTASATNTPTYRLGQELKDRYQAEKKDLKEKNKEVSASSSAAREIVREEHRLQIDTLRRERIMLFARKMIKRLNAALDRSRGFVSRINTLLTKWEDRGQVVDGFRVKLTEANKSIIESQTRVDQILPTIESALTATSSAIAFDQVKGAINESMNAIKDTHAQIVEVIKSLNNRSTSTAAGTKED